MMKAKRSSGHVAEAVVTAVVGFCAGTLLAVCGLELEAPEWVVPVSAVVATAGIFVAMPMVSVRE